ncbi:hypothetical protein DFQ28_011306 [Apophysomyces sp. BC1034]|nr:hypothetical protein DFQ30_011086 [Apophysomyces sp. BC1015]KAG0169321.1 hypothetical protein DFQ29_009734 [Apophysomyces sp. BC1021]KAG0184373.1 hypothetical protein DFQ28_011306 [Apophysomyces sp. BC1034]
MSDTPAKVTVIGAGLVGTLNTIYFAQRGWDVSLYDSRQDMRLPEEKDKLRGKSINLSLSERGLSALRATGLGLEKAIVDAAVPMCGRMIHTGKEGKQVSQPYSVHGNYTNSVDRARLNALLLDVAEKMPNVSIQFEHHLTSCDMDAGILEFRNTGFQNSLVKHQTDLLVGADGAHSTVRSQMMRKIRMDYHQDYIDTVYCELVMPAIKGKTNQPEPALDPTHLHIWPRHTFMLIALPNPDYSFTCTLFMPLTMFQEINTEENLMEFFGEHFNDTIPLFGEKHLKTDFFANPRGSLISIKTSSYNYEDKVVIMGDAAHAMVPFYGQGMNCGFQDVEELHRILDSHVDRPIKINGIVPGMKTALDCYSETRVKDAHAMCDLATYNYVEMRSHVVSRSYVLRKRIEGFIHLFFPRLLIPLFTMVSFSTLPYSAVVKRWQRQDYWLNVAIGSFLMGGGMAATMFSLQYHNYAKPLMEATLNMLSQSH